MDKPSIIRAEHKNHYVVITNALARDTNLSYAARGLLLTLLSYPDDWSIRPGNLRQKGCGYNQVYKLLHELIEMGYLKREDLRDEKKRRTTLYTALEIPEKPSDGIHDKVKISPSNGIHHHENHDHENHDVLRNTKGKPSTQGKQSNDIVTPSAPQPKLPSPSKPKKLERNQIAKLNAPPLRVAGPSPKLPPPPKPIAKPVPKPAAKPTQKKSRKPQPSDVLWNAIADCFFDGARVGNQRLGRILHGQDSHGLFGLIAFEVEHQNTQTLDFEMLAFLVPKFKESLPDDPKRTDSRGKPMKLELRDPAKFIERWIGWRCTTPNGHTSEPPMMNYDPACPHGCDKGIVYFTDEKGQTATRYCTCRVKILEARKGRVL